MPRPKRTPKQTPWINVIANASFGFLVSAEGGGWTWSLNSQQNRLTPWPNDPVSDTPHEVLYLRDEDSVELWSATALPIRVPSQFMPRAIWSIFAFAALGQGDRAGDLFAILNPIHHSSTPEAVARYKVEPYAACADVYSVAPHVGRGGWIS